jgi:hypothetical protein
VAIISANLGGYESHSPEWPAQVVPDGVTVDVHRFTDATFSPRSKAMTPSLQCGLLKMFGPEFVPGYDVYLWVDASCTPTPTCVAWFLRHLGDAEMAIFAHPDRSTVQEEYEFIKSRMARPGETYLNRRYAGEWIDEQYAAIASGVWGGATLQGKFVDNALYASTAFMYRPTICVEIMGRLWWYGKTRYFLHDQLWWPFAIYRSTARVNVIRESYLRCEALTYTRKK